MEKISEAVKKMETGDTEGALEILQNVLTTATDIEKFQVVDAYYDWGFFDKAVVILEQLLVDYPDEGEIIVQLAELYIELQNDERAMELLNDITAEDPVYLASLIHLADLYQAQGLFEVSEQKLLIAKSLAPEEVVIDFALGELLFSIGQYNRAIPYFEKVVKESATLNAISIPQRLAESNALIGDYEQALLHYESAESKDPNTLFKHGFTARQVKRNDIALTVFRKLLELDPHYHSAYYELAQTLRDEGMNEEAREIVARGLGYDQHNKELFLLAGHIEVTLRHPEKAIEYVQEAIKLDSDYKEAVLVLIDLYKDIMEYKEIILLLERIKREGGTDPLYDWEEARAYVAEELYEKANTSYEVASNQLMHDAEFLKEYGYFLVEEGEINRAVEILTNYLQFEGQDEEVISFLERIRFSDDSNL